MHREKTEMSLSRPERRIAKRAGVQRRKTVPTALIAI
jgi:hypothetical protein